MTTSRAIETLNFRMITHVTASLAHEVGDVDDHRLSLSTFSGWRSSPMASWLRSSFTLLQTTSPELALSRSIPLSTLTMLLCCS